MKYFIINGYKLDTIFIDTFSKMDNWSRTYNISEADFIYYPLKHQFDTKYSMYINSKFCNNFIDSDKKLCKMTDNCMNNKVKLNTLLKNYDFIPKSYTYKYDDFSEFQNIYQKNDIYIIKPESQFARKGMAIVNNYNDLQNHIKSFKSQNWVFQKYIINPLLFNKKKFHIRSYVLVVRRKDDIFAYVHKIGYMYVANNKFTLQHLDFESHMTGAKYCNVYDLNNFSNYFGEDKYNLVWKQIQNITNVSVSEFNINNNFNLPNNNTAFHLFAYDILVDDNFKAYLLEINNGIVGFETLPLYQHMCVNKKEPRMHPMSDLKIIFHDLIHLVINQNPHNFVLCYKDVSQKGFVIKTTSYKYFIIFIIVLFVIGFYLYNYSNNLNNSELINI